jgi:hypothetical protein
MSSSPAPMVVGTMWYMSLTLHIPVAQYLVESSPRFFSRYLHWHNVFLLTIFYDESGAYSVCFYAKQDGMI